MGETMNGYAGAILYVDLTAGSVRKVPLDPAVARKFIGGYGINLKLAAELIDPDVDPLSPANKIILGVGPFNGTFIPGGSKIHITTKNPMNGVIARSSGGGVFGTMLKSSGYDHVVISGRAKSPVYLRILDDQVELCAADDLWGKDTYETVDLLRERHATPCSVIPIGPAGENQVKISLTNIDKCGTVGRGGLPAVMGSKNLKAIVACQGSRQLEVADRPALTKMVHKILKRMEEWPGRERLVQNGMSALAVGMWKEEPLLYENATKCREATAEEVRAQDQALAEAKKNRKPLGCSSCATACKEVVRVESGEHAGTVFYGNRLWFGTDRQEDFGKTTKYSSMINRLGVDRMDLFALAPFVTALYREGIVSREDLGGLEPKEQDYETNVRILEMVAYRKGFGAVLGEGLVGAARIIGKGAEKHVQHVKGHALVFDPRAKGLFGTMEFTQLSNPRGAHVSFGGGPAYQAGRPLEDFLRHGERMGMPAEAYPRVFDETSFNVGRLSRYSEDWASLFDCMGLCNRAFVNRFYHVQTIGDLYAALTGIRLSPAELMTAAERCWNLWRALNARCGYDRKDDRPPKIWFDPLEGEGKTYALVDYYGRQTYGEGDLEKYLDDYYDERGWSRATGNPGPEKLKALGLEEELAPASTA